MCENEKPDHMIAIYFGVFCHTFLLKTYNIKFIANEFKRQELKKRRNNRKYTSKMLIILTRM